MWDVVAGWMSSLERGELSAGRGRKVCEKLGSRLLGIGGIRSGGVGVRTLHLTGRGATI